MTRMPVERARKIIEAGLPIGPRLYPCVCGEGRHAHSGGNHTGGAKATGCRRYRPDNAWLLAYDAIDAQATTLGHALREADKRERTKHYKDNPRQPGEWSIGASDTTTCPKKIEYRNKPPEDLVRDPVDNREARIGTIIHDEVTDKVRALYPWRIFKGKVRIAGLDRDSEFDVFDPVTGEIEDYKTAGEWKWEQLGPDGPDDDTWGQVFLYGLALEDEGHVVNTVRLSYLRRSNGHDETFVRPYERAFAEKYRDMLLGYAQSLDLGIELPRSEPGPSLSGLCRRCEFRSDCWNIPAAEKAGRSPESYTVLGPDPDDEDIVWSIKEFVRTRRARLDAKAAEDEAKVLLEGIPTGRYGSGDDLYEGWEKWTPGGDDPYARVRQLEEWINTPEDERVPFDTLPVPQKRKTTYVWFDRMRKATRDKIRRESAQLDKGNLG